MFSKLAYDIFWESILRYHIADDVNQPFENPYGIYPIFTVQ